MTTPNNGWPLAFLTDSPNGAGQLQSLADAIDTAMVPWTDWTPALTAVTTNPNLGTSPTAQGRYTVANGLVQATATIVFGTSPSAGSGEYRVSLPVSGNNADTATIVGAGLIHNSGWTRVHLLYVTADTVKIDYIDGTGAIQAVSDSLPAAWAAAGQIQLALAYEAA